MDFYDPDSLTRLLQMTLSPVALISGVGLLLLSMTNRLGRTIDRSRALVSEMKHIDDPKEVESLTHQVRILYQRSHILKIAITLISCSIFFSSFIIISLFLINLFNAHLEYAVIGLLVLSLLSISASIAFFIWDVFITLRALRLEIMAHI